MSSENNQQLVTSNNIKIGVDTAPIYNDTQIQMTQWLVYWFVVNCDRAKTHHPIFNPTKFGVACCWHECLKFANCLL